MGCLHYCMVTIRTKEKLGFCGRVFTIALNKVSLLYFLSKSEEIFVFCTIYQISLCICFLNVLIHSLFRLDREQKFLYVLILNLRPDKLKLKQKQIEYLFINTEPRKRF